METKHLLSVSSSGISLLFQQLRLCAPHAGDPGLIPSCGNTFCFKKTKKYLQVAAESPLPYSAHCPFNHHHFSCDGHVASCLYFCPLAVFNPEGEWVCNRKTHHTSPLTALLTGIKFILAFRTLLASSRILSLWVPARLCPSVSSNIFLKPDLWTITRKVKRDHVLTSSQCNSVYYYIFSLL